MTRKTAAGSEAKNIQLAAKVDAPAELHVDHFQTKGSAKASKHTALPEETRNEKVLPIELEEQQTSLKEIVDSLEQAVTNEVRRNSVLNSFWKEIDDSARFYVLLCVAQYTGFIPEPLTFINRKERYGSILLEVAAHIRVLKATLAKRREFEAKEKSWRGEKYYIRYPHSPEPNIISRSLEHEVERLEVLTKGLRDICNESRLGLAGALYHLVLAQDFVERWAELNSKDLHLRPVELAELIGMVQATRGFARPDHNRAENLKRALSHFRSNAKNQALLSLLSEHVNSIVAQWLAWDKETKLSETE